MSAKNNTPKPVVPATRSIAVLPFVNMSSDPANEYFSDGITEEIINALTTIEGLKVIARTSSFAFKGQAIDIRTIGQQLGVSAILEGSVRKVQERVRITAQLVQTDDGSHLWSKNFDRDLGDIFALQDEISLLIADRIRENFGHFDIQDHLIKAPTQSIDAYSLYLKARYHQLQWNAEGMVKSISLYQQSIEADPNFALPYFGAGMMYVVNASWGFIPYEEGIKQAKELITMGTQIIPNSYLSDFAQATFYFWGKWGFKIGHEYLLKALEFNASFTDAEEGMAELYTAIGAFDKAMHHTHHVLQLNPLSPNHYYTQGNIHYLSGNYEKAISSMENALRVNPHFALAKEVIALCYIHLKAYEQLETLLNTPSSIERPAECRALYQLIHTDAPISSAISISVPEVAEEGPDSLIPWQLYLHIYSDQHAQALDILEAGIQRRAGQFVNFKNDPFLKPLHASPRFQQLLETIFHPSNLPELIAAPPSPTDSGKTVLSPEEVEHYLAQLQEWMEVKQLFLDQELNLKHLAERIKIHSNKLSWLLNEHIGKNFNEYVNTHRLEIFKQKALDPANAHLTLLGLAYESGFNSKTVFNAFFKKVENMTPRAWVKAQT